MLSSVIIGSLAAEVNNDWEITADKRGINYISNQSIGQRVKLGRGVTPFLAKRKSSANMAVYDVNETPDVDQVPLDDPSEVYDIPTPSFICNSNISMDVMLNIYKSSSMEDIASHEDDNICFVTVMNSNYKIIGYNTFKQNIVTTYMTYNKFQGCAVKHRSNSDKIIELILRDLSANRFVKATVLRDSSTGSITVDKVHKFDKSEYDKIKAKAASIGEHVNQFKIIINGLPTATYLTTEDLYDEVDKLTANIPNKNIVTIADGTASFEYTDQKDIDSLDAFLTEKFVDHHIKAITTVGVRVPKDFCKKYKISYLFDYSLEKKKLYCVRSR